MPSTNFRPVEYVKIRLFSLHFEKITRSTKVDKKGAKRIDTRTYNHVKGTVTLNQYTRNFGFNLKNYHKLLNFKVIAEIIDENL